MADPSAVAATKVSAEEPWRGRIAAGLAGDRGAVASLLAALRPVLHARVARVVAQSPRARDRGRPQVEDLTQEIFLALFRDDGRALRAWDPGRGMSLANWVGLFAESAARSYLRSGRRAGWREDPTLSESLDGEDDAPALDATIASRETLSLLLHRLQEELSPLGLHLFHLCVIEDRSVEEVAELCSMTSAAVYAWRSRLAKHARKLRDELEAPPALTSIQGAP